MLIPPSILSIVLPCFVLYRTKVLQLLSLQILNNLSCLLHKNHESILQQDYLVSNSQFVFFLTRNLPRKERRHHQLKQKKNCASQLKDENFVTVKVTK